MDAEPNLGLPPYLREPGTRPTRRAARRRPPVRGVARRRPRKLVWLPLIALLFLSPAIYSWGQMMRLPMSESTWQRSVEWLGQHHFRWLITKVEHYNDTWFHAPQKFTQVTPSSIDSATGNLLLLGRVTGHVEHHGAALRFQVKDIGGHKRARIWADYSGSVPDGFRTGRGISVTGTMSNGTFAATGSLALVERGTQPRKHHHTESYEPPNIKPVFTYHLPGEGVWRPTGPPVNGGPPVLVTTFRTETAYPQITAYVAWFDHTRTASAYYPGTYEPPSAALRGPTQIPSAQRYRLLSTFNGGFIYTDGLNGDAVNGVTNEPMTKGNATAIGYKSGAVNIISWKGGTHVSKNVAWARQSLPLIVDNGKPNPALDLSTAWGYTLDNAVRVWRTGLGIDAHGNLIYVAASYQTVMSLADILIRAGAVRAMELDINPEWYTLLTYRHSHHELVPTQVAYNYQQPSTRYLVPDDRDFFAIYRRLPGAITVPLN
jgi:cytochrome c-type biogenesis protein CcmE